jgi:hypothetical protein
MKRWESHRTVDVDRGSKRPGAGGVEEAGHELVALGLAVCFDIARLETICCPSGLADKCRQLPEPVSHGSLTRPTGLPGT